MWIYTKPRNEHDIRFMLNLDLCTRVNVNQLGERWFLDVTLDSESIPVASSASEQEAFGLLQLVFDSLKNGRKALDLVADAPAAPANAAAAPAQNASSAAERHAPASTPGNGATGGVPAGGQPMAAAGDGHAQPDEALAHVETPIHGEGEPAAAATSSGRSRGRFPSFRR